MTYNRYGTLCIRENPQCLFIATNRDAVGHMTNLQEWPGSVLMSYISLVKALCMYDMVSHFISFACISGAGCMVAAIAGSTEKEPIVVGKPSTFMMDFLLQK